jgi:hypothetical protein
MKGLVVMTNTKMTQEKALVFALELDEIKGNKEVADKLADMLEAVRKKRESKTISKTQARNEVLKADILDLMAEDTSYTCTQIVKMLNSDEVPSTQKGTALLKSLAEDGKVIIIRDKKSTLFKRVA